MNYNNTTSIYDICGMPDSFRDWANKLFFVAYYVLPPIYLIFGLAGHVIFLRVLIRQAISENAYSYQIYFVISETLFTLSLTGDTLSIAVCGLIGQESIMPFCPLFSTNFPYVWYRAHLATYLSNAFGTTSILLALVVAGDRLFALAKPFAYRLLNQRKCKLISTILCLTVSLGSSIFECFRRIVLPGQQNVGSNSPSWIVIYDDRFTQTSFASILNNFRNAIRFVGVFGLIIFNTGMIILYRRRFTKVHVIGANSSQGSHADNVDKQIDPKKERRKRDETTLLILAIYQSSLMAVSVIISIVLYVSMDAIPSFKTCGTMITTPLMDIACQLTTGFDFYILLLTSKRFRTLLKN